MAIQPLAQGAERVFLKLDPGEFGFAGSLPAEAGPRAVAAQELGNKLQFLREALVKGLNVDLATVSLSPSVDGAVSGKTEVQFSDRQGLLEQLKNILPVPFSLPTGLFVNALA